MKFDPECVKAILQAYEDLPVYNENTDLGLAKYSDEVLFHHQLLLGDENYILFKNISNQSDPFCLLPIRITMKGQEFLNASRNKDGWQKVRSASAKAGGFVLSVASDILKEYLKEQLSKMIL